MLTEQAPGDQEMLFQGQWDPIKYSFTINPVHIALLHTGKLLAFGGSGNDRWYAKNPRPANIWDPQTGEIKIIDQKLKGDVFCSGHTFLSDGKLLVVGGTYKYDHKHFGIPSPPFTGISQTCAFDPVTETWMELPDMANARWYPSVIMLGDERVLTLAGFTRSFPWVLLRKLEVLTIGKSWETLKNADRWLPLYPRLHLLPDGNIFYAGSYNTHYTFPFTLKGFPTAILNVTTGKWIKVGLPGTSEREEGSTVLLPFTPPDYKARVLLLGGGMPLGTTATADAEIIDLSTDKPTWRKVAPMKHQRYYSYAVILPDKKILVLGGRGGEKGMPEMPDPTTGEIQIPMHDPLAVLEPEIFDPATESWTPAASMTLDRLYHAGALLLPDGRVVATGSNPMPGTEEHRIEIYSPAYIFAGSRPEILDMPEKANLGQKFEILTVSAVKIDEVALIHATSTTHCFSTDQRYVGLAIVDKTADRVTVLIPENNNIVPPGYYMVFILSNGIPSVAKFIRVY
jgi:hypothetical protein